MKQIFYQKDGMTYDEISKILNISKQRVRQIEKGAIKKLKHPKFVKILKEYI